MQILNEFYDKICCQTKPFFPIPYSFDFGQPEDIEYNTQTFQSNQITTTKYNLINFLPKAVISQYKRFANFYFLTVAIISSVPNITPLNPALIWMPLVVVLVISIVKQAYQDYQRYKLDKQINNQYQVLVIRNGQQISISWKDLKVGDICRVMENQTFPADLLLISSSQPDGTAYIQTASLDGEKTSKTRYSFPVLNQLNQLVHFIDFKGSFWGRFPNNSLDEFKADLVVAPDMKIQIEDNKQFLYRGAKLKNTAWVWGLAIYTGQCTKIMLNSKSFTSKISTVQKKLNYMLLTFLAIQFVLCVTIASLSTVSIDDFLQKHYYISYRKKSDISLFFNSFLVYFIDFSSLIPISLIVSIELIKLAQSYFIDFDKLMFSKQKDRGVLAKCAALNEELGQIQYVFTDKTGTLTKNKMTFDTAIIGDHQFNFTYNQQQKKYQCLRLEEEIRFSLRQDPPERLKLTTQQNTFLIDSYPKLIHQYFMCLLVCNSVNLVSKDGEVNYESESPDELALIRAAKCMGYQLLKRQNNCLKVSINKQVETIKVLDTFNFSSDRKRMSVIIQYRQFIMLYIKGADNIILQRSNPTKFRIQENIKFISRKGLRTLLLGVKLVSPHHYAQFKQKLDLCSHANRQELIQQFSEQFESEIQLLGCTGLLDELQDEVASTLKDLQRANIKVWMLTGDKFQTALEIGKSCRLIDGNYQIIECRSSDSSISAQIDDMQHIIQDNKLQKYSLVIEGSRLTQIFNNKQLGKKFAEFSTHFQTVICCRMLPIQKAEIVKLVKNSLNKICLSIGDGGNDVSMIKQGNIGIGIYGEQGMNAVQASDYAIPEFRMIWRLLFVHGRWNYMRISEMILYFTYKSILFTIPRIIYAFVCRFSGEPVYDDLYIALYNIIFTSVPLIVRALFDQDINYVYKREVPTIVEEHPKNQKGSTSIQRINQQQYLPNGFAINKTFRNLLPKVYFIGQKNQIFNPTNCILWSLESTLVGLFSTLLIIYTIGNKTLNRYGYNSDLWIVSVSIYTSIIMMCTFKLAIHVRHWTLLILVSIVFCSLAPYLSYVWISNFYFSKFRIEGTIIMSFRTGASYLSVLIACILMLAVNGIVIYINFYKSKRLSKMQIIMKQIQLQKQQDIQQNIITMQRYTNTSKSQLSFQRNMVDIKCKNLQGRRQ